MKDCIGREIVAGGDIVYPIRKSYNVTMSRMKVIEVKADSLSGLSPAGHRVTLKKCQNVVVVEIPKPVIGSE